MIGQAQLSKTFEGLEVTVYHEGKPVKAIVTREALEVLWQATLTKPGAVLDSYHRHQTAIEVAILDRDATQRKQPVVVHVLD